MEALVSTGNFGLMHQYGVDWAAKQAALAAREAMHVMPPPSSTRKIDFKGDFFQYSGLGFTAARPVQEADPAADGR